MNGKWIALVLAASFWTAAGCKKTPTVSARRTTAGSVPAAPSQIGRPDAKTLMGRLMAAYEWEPTSERAAAVWDGFEKLDLKLSELKKRVAIETGGIRAEAEIERIELQRVREAAMARFASTQARLKTARAALDALTASLDREGIRAAADAIAQGSRAESRFAGRDLPDHLRGVQMQTP